MRVLVTGGAGYIGSIAARTFLDAGHDVTVLDSLERGHAAAVDSRATFVQAPVSDTEALAHTLPGTDLVLHFAGYIDVAESQADPALYFRKNLQEPSVMLVHMLDSGVRHLVFSSTAAVYGQPDTIPITEDAPTLPINAYGQSKMEFERRIEDAESTGELSAVRLRYFNVAGAWPDGSLGEAHDPETHIVPRLLAAAASGDPFTVFGDDYPTPDGTCVRDYIHVLDLANAHLAAAEHLMRDGEGLACNVGGGRGYSNLEIAETCARALGRDIQLILGERRPGDPATLVASVDRARQVLGWAPERDLETMVRDAWRWHSTHPNGYRD